MPDALSKTIPIWCCVLNRALFPDDTSCHPLHAPPHVVSSSEKSQMESRLPEFLASFLALHPNLPSLRRHLTKPLRPLWITQDDQLSPTLTSHVTASFHPVVCCTSSRRVVGTEIGEAGYIQGAGDDTENWALGLTAPIFWAHKAELLRTPEPELPALIASLLVSSDAREGVRSDLVPVAPRLLVGTLAVSPGPLLAEGACVVVLLPKATEQTAWAQSSSHLEVGLGKSKAASRRLREALPTICEFVSRYLARSTEEEKEVVLLCETGKDLSVGVALALSCWCFDDDGNFCLGEKSRSSETFNKGFIRVRLGQMMTAMPEANPSRATLQSVNSFLMDWRK
jgi:tRNA A64-2'-O-ribosylphosphate transferase